MKYTLLQLTQKVLSSMDSDEINSIFDTTEAGQVVDIIQTVYFNIVSIGELPRDDDIFQLNASGSSSLPVTMTLPDTVDEIRWIKYDNHTTSNTVVNYQEVYPMPLWDFIQMVTNFDTSDTTVTTYTHAIGTDTFTLYCKNNHAPQFYTTTNDNTILFDSYDSAVDATLQKSKTMVFGQRTFPWSATDSFVPPLDDKQHQRLLNEAKALAFAELKQTQHASAEKTARELKINQQSSKHKIPTQTAYDQIVGMGRRSRIGWEKPTGRYK